MVEAALVFPLIILTVLALIHMLVFLYQQTELRARMHIALRAESGQVTQTVEYITKVNASYPIDHRGGQVFYASSVEFSKKGILNRRTKELSAHKYADDEAMFVRMVDLAQIKEQADEK